MPPASSDAVLIDRLRAGDEAAFGELVDRYHAQLIRLARSVVSQPETAEDIAQETWLALFKSIDTFEGRSTLKTWLFQICVNRARTVGVREHRMVPVDEVGPAVDAAQFNDSGAWTSPPVAWPERLAEAGDDAELAEQIRCAIDKLPATQRTVVTLRDVDGLSAKQVCEILSITEANQRVLLHRGRERIRVVMNQVVIR